MEQLGKIRHGRKPGTLCPLRTERLAVEEADDRRRSPASQSRNRSSALSACPCLGELSCGKQDEAGLADLASRCSYGKTRTIGTFRVLDYERSLRSTAGPTKRKVGRHEKLAISAPASSAGAARRFLLRDVDLLERNAGEQLELAYVLARRAAGQAVSKTRPSRIFSVIEHDADVFLVIETIGGGAALEHVRRALAAGRTS